MSSRVLSDRFRAFVAPTILVVIACTQVYRVHAQQLTPWKGGGFGMFSTVHSRGSRFVRAHLVRRAEGQTYRLRIRVPRDWRALERELRFMPTPRRARALASKLARVVWQQKELTEDERALAASGDGYQGQSPETWPVGVRSTLGRAAGVDVEFESVQIEVFEFGFEGHDQGVVGRQLIDLEVQGRGRR